MVGNDEVTHAADQDQDDGDLLARLAPDLAWFERQGPCRHLDLAGGRRDRTVGAVAGVAAGARREHGGGADHQEQVTVAP